MKKMITFNEYLLTKLNEEMELRIKALELVLSPRLIKILRQMNHQIADDLLERHFESDEPEFKATFVDIGPTPGEVTYIMSSKVAGETELDVVHGAYNREKPGVDELGRKVFKGGYYDYVQMGKNPWISDIYHQVSLHDQQFKDKDHPVWTKHRVTNKIMKLVTLLFPNKYPLNYKRDEAAKLEKLDDLESFQNMFTTLVEENSKIIKEVQGEDVRKFYNRNNHFLDTGTLRGSCMADPEKQPYLVMYSLNPKNVTMLVLFPEDVRDKIIGRALLWNLPDGRKFMDRIYTSKDADEYMFIEYAKANGYYYKTSQTYGWDHEIIDGKNGNRVKLDIQIEFDDTSFEQYPYLDTLQFFNHEKNILTNNKQLTRVEGEEGQWKLLTHTSGGYQNV